MTSTSHVPMYFRRYFEYVLMKIRNNPGITFEKAVEVDGKRMATCDTRLHEMIDTGLVERYGVNSAYHRTALRLTPLGEEVADVMDLASHGMVDAMSNCEWFGQVKDILVYPRYKQRVRRGPSSAERVLDCIRKHPGMKTKDIQRFVSDADVKDVLLSLRKRGLILAVPSDEIARNGRRILTFIPAEAVE